MQTEDASTEAAAAATTAPLQKSKTKKETFVRNATTKQIIVRAINNAQTMYNRGILIATLEMLKSRGSRYKVDDLLSSLSDVNTPITFQTAILMSEFRNPLRDILACGYKARTAPTIRVMMSILIRNSPTEETFTAVFFAERSQKQVAKKLIKGFFEALLFLKSARIVVTETIFITPVALSHDSENQRKWMHADCFSQVFRDSDILSPPTRFILTPKIRVLARTAEERADFFTKETSVSRTKLQQIPHSDPLLHYLGIRPNTIIEILRPAVVPLNIRETELTIAWVMWRRPLVVGVKKGSSFRDFCGVKNLARFLILRHYLICNTLFRYLQADVLSRVFQSGSW